MKLRTKEERANFAIASMGVLLAVSVLAFMIAWMGLKMFLLCVLTIFAIVVLLGAVVYWIGSGAE